MRMILVSMLALVMMACGDEERTADNRDLRVAMDSLLSSRMVLAATVSKSISPDSFKVYTMNSAFSEAVVSICDTTRRCVGGTMPKVTGVWDGAGKYVRLKAPSVGMSKFVLRVRYVDGRRSRFTVQHNSTDPALSIYLHIHGFENAPNWPALSPGFAGFAEVYPDGMTPGACKEGTTWIDCSPPPRVVSRK